MQYRNLKLLGRPSGYDVPIRPEGIKFIPQRNHNNLDMDTRTLEKGQRAAARRRGPSDSAKAEYTIAGQLGMKKKMYDATGQSWSQRGSVELTEAELYGLKRRGYTSALKRNGIPKVVPRDNLYTVADQIMKQKMFEDSFPKVRTHVYSDVCTSDVLIQSNDIYYLDRARASDEA